jgi:hypothetical protein
MFSSLLRRSGAVVAIAASALVAGTAVAATPHPTSLSIRAASPVIVAGHTDTVFGDLRLATGAALAGKTVTLEARTAAQTAFAAIGTAVSGPHGGVSFKVLPTAVTRYRWTFAGDTADAASTSGTVTIKVTTSTGVPTKLPTSLSIREASPVVSATGTDTISGRLLSGRFPLRDQLVSLLARRVGTTGWVVLRAKRTGLHGGVAFLVAPKHATSYRLAYAGNANFRAVRSGVVLVGMRPAA